MREFAGKTAFVTGGASGIGLALGPRLRGSGHERDARRYRDGVPWIRAVNSLHHFGPKVRGVVCDVADPASVERAAKAAFEAFGNVHVVCNNAGVAAGGGIDNISLDNWRWVLDVNLMGVFHGIRSFLPHIRAHGEGGHIVNTASMAGMNGGLGFSPYAASKFAVVAMSEGLAIAAQAAWHRGQRALPELRAHPHRRERTQPAAALWRDAAARSGKSVRPDGRRDRTAH